MEWLSDPQIWISLGTLMVMEIILGVDNIIFISILAGKLPEHQQAKARQIGLALALITRMVLLCGISWMAKLVTPLFGVMGHDFSGRDLILLGGGLFLIAKSTHEIHEKLEGVDGGKSAKLPAQFSSIIIQIILIDVVFSLDSVITAVGMTNNLWVMVVAVIVAMGVMLAFAESIGNFVHRHPAIKMLALSFLLLIGVMLVAEGFDQHIPKGYIYFAMAFSVMVEMLNMKFRRKSQPVELSQPYR
jgi:predicted tellurium resistance membrane protein TerC